MSALGRLFSPRQRRIKKAADEMWQQLLTGISFEVGAVLSTDSDTAQAVLLLRKNHPEVSLTLQSKGWVLSREKTSLVSEDAWGWLERGGYTPDNQIQAQGFFDAHARWMHRNDNTQGNVEDVVARTQRKVLQEELRRHAIDVSAWSK